MTDPKQASTANVTGSPSVSILGTMFVLAVPDLAASAAFYRDVLGFRIDEIGDPGWRLFERDGCRIMAGECPDAIPPRELGDHGYFGYLVVDDATAYHGEVLTRGAEIVKPLRDEPWGMREFVLRTADGHRLAVGEPLPEA
jgi:catechol 2,3-dioxygenase-like lactoylglutathione lyase family enzyme